MVQFHVQADPASGFDLFWILSKGGVRSENGLGPTELGGNSNIGTDHMHCPTYVAVSPLLSCLCCAYEQRLQEK